jgi:hypothetical protein
MADPRRRFADIFFHGWKSSLAALIAGMAVSVLLFGFWMPYWRIADQDMILAYQGLLFNDGRAQDYFDHPGYLSYLAIGAWYRLLHLAGVLQTHALSELPAATDAPAFNQAWQHLIEAGRALSFIFGAVFVYVYATLVRRIVGDWRLALVAAVALAYSGGFAMHIRMMRTELLSSAFVTTALLLVLVAAREDRSLRRNVLLMLAGLCSALAVAAKVQAILPALAIPVIALAFGCRLRETDDQARRLGTSGAVAALIVAIAAAAGYPAAALLLRGTAGLAEFAMYHPLGGGLSGVYQWCIALLVAAAMLTYAVVWRVRPIDTIAALGSVTLGLAIGVLSLDLRYDLHNVVAVANPIEHMFVFASAGASAFANQSQLVGSALFATFASAVVKVLAMHTFVLSTSARPTLLLEWFTIVGAIILWRRGERSLPLQVGLLVSIVWALDAVFTFRGLQIAYFVYTDPLLILAAVLVLSHLPDLQNRPSLQRRALAALAVYVVWAHLEPVKHALTRGEPQESCKWFPDLIPRVEHFPFCNT